MRQRAKRLVGSFLGIFAVALVLSAPSIASVVARQVDNTNVRCNDATGTPVYCTIQAAVNASSPGEEVDVSASTYHELVVVNKALMLFGAKHGIVATAASRGPGQRIGAGGPAAAGTRTPSFDITARNVILDGFTVQ